MLMTKMIVSPIGESDYNELLRQLSQFCLGDITC